MSPQVFVNCWISNGFEDLLIVHAQDFKTKVVSRWERFMNYSAVRISEPAIEKYWGHPMCGCLWLSTLYLQSSDFVLNENNHLSDLTMTVKNIIVMSKVKVFLFMAGYSLHAISQFRSNWGLCEWREHFPPPKRLIGYEGEILILS